MVGATGSTLERDRARPGGRTGSRPAGARRTGRPVHNRAMYAVFLLPAAVLVVGLMVYPLITSVSLSLHAGNTFNPAAARFVGLQNYRQFLADPAAPQLVLNTIIRGVGGVVPSYILGVAAAVALNKRVRGMGVIRILVLLPFVISAPVTIGQWKLMLDPQSGLPAVFGLEIANLFSNEQLVWPTLLVMNAWGSFQFYAILLLAGLQRIPQELYDAAAVDGASRWRRFTSVTAPGIAVISGAVCVLHFMSSFQDFQLVYIATGGGPLNRTQTLPTYAYQSAFGGGYRVGYATAVVIVCALLMVIILAVVVGAVWVLSRLVRAARSRDMAAAARAVPAGQAAVRSDVTRRRPIPSRPPGPVSRLLKRTGSWPVLAIAFALFSSFPTLYLLSQSLDGRAPGTGEAALLPREPTLQNYVNVLSSPAIWQATSAAPPLVQNFLNSAIVVFAVTVLSLGVAALAGYALSRWHGVVSNAFLALLVAIQLIPGIILLFPLYQLAAKFQMLDRTGQILATTTMFVPMAILFFRVYFAESSREIEEAAALDGAGALRTFLFVVIPNAGTAFGAMGAFALINSWNEFTLALTLVSDPAERTFPPALAQFTSGFEFAGQVGPGGQAVFLLLPAFISALLLALTVKHFTTAVAGGGAKG